MLSLHDWESYQVRIDRIGRVRARASSHRAYHGCKLRRCRNRWIAATGKQPKLQPLAL